MIFREIFYEIHRFVGATPGLSNGPIVDHTTQSVNGRLKPFEIDLLIDF